MTSAAQRYVGGRDGHRSITNEAVDELGPKAGTSAYVVIKATDVMVGIE